jgi:5'-3' exonuclease
MIKEFFERMWAWEKQGYILKLPKAKRSIKTFATVEEYRDYVVSISKNKTYKQIANRLNKEGYRTIRGILFNEHSVMYYTKNDATLAKLRSDAKFRKQNKTEPIIFNNFLKLLKSKRLAISSYQFKIESIKPSQIVFEITAHNEIDFENLYINDYNKLEKISVLAKKHFNRDICILGWKSYNYDSDPLVYHY